MMTAEPAAKNVAELDLRGLKCPLPVLHTRRALARLPAGAMLRVKTSDPMAVIDIPHLLHQGGDVLRSATQHGWGMQFDIAKGGISPASRPGPD